jgi:hypothetical protein
MSTSRAAAPAARWSMPVAGGIVLRGCAKPQELRSIPHPAADRHREMKRGAGVAPMAEAAVAPEEVQIV